MNADVKFQDVHTYWALLLALLLALGALLAPVVADNVLGSTLVPPALADGPQHSHGG